MDGKEKKPVDLRAVKSSAKAELSRVEGVEGFGTGDRCLRIYVRNHAVKHHLPRVFHGVPVEFIITGTIAALRP